MIRVAGVDMSLTATGVARLTVDDYSDGAPATSTRAVTSPATTGDVAARWMRLDGIATAVADFVWLGNGPTRPDLVLVESPTYAADVTGSSHDRAGLWWALVGELLGRAVTVYEVHPSHLKMYATGRGSHVTKKQVVDAVRGQWGHLFDIPLHGPGVDDIADAVTLACLAAHVLGEPVTDVTPAQRRAVAKVRIPERI